MTLVWEISARREVGDIYSDMFDYSPASAGRWAEDVERKTALLLAFPEMGRMVPDIKVRTIREIFAGRCRIVYQVRDENVVIMAVRPMGQPLGII